MKKKLNNNFQVILINTKQLNKQMSAVTIEMLSQRVEALEKQLKLLSTSNSPPPPAEKKEKKPKKEKKSDSDDEKPKKKRVSGYLLFSSAMRDDVKKELFGDEKPKNSEIMVELGKRWKALSDEERTVWNDKAKEEASEPED